MVDGFRVSGRAMPGGNIFCRVVFSGSAMKPGGSLNPLKILKKLNLYFNPRSGFFLKLSTNAVAMR